MRFIEDGIGSEITKYASSKVSSGEHYVKQEKIQGIVDGFMSQHAKKPGIQQNRDYVDKLLKIIILRLANAKVEQISTLEFNAGKITNFRTYNKK